MGFQVKDNMKVAPTVREVMSVERKVALDEAIDKQVSPFCILFMVLTCTRKMGYFDQTGKVRQFCPKYSQTRLIHLQNTWRQGDLIKGLIEHRC